MKNKMSDLNNHLFAQLERLGEENMTSEQIADEVRRAGALANIADQIIRNANVQLAAVTIIANHGDRVRPMLPALIGDDK